MSEAQQGMGAIIFPGGVAFRVWAPNADSVSVFGDFNDWDNAEHQLANEGNGYWYGEVANAKAGDKYKFHLTNGDWNADRIDPYAYEVTNSVGEGVIYDHSTYDWEDDAFEMPAFNEVVIYEMHVGSFLDEPDGPSTLEQVAAKLDHVVNVGANVVQLMPVMEFAGDMSWGYNPAYIFSVESAYGGPDALKDFVKAAHKKGLGVMIDVVYNHLGPSDLDIWQFDGWSENDKGGIYFYNDWRSQTPWGDTRPDYGREEVRNFLRDNAMMWLRDYHADGLRYDMTPYISSAEGGQKDIPEGWNMMRWINESIRHEWPGKLLVAEDLHSDTAIVTYGDGGAAFHAQWDERFVHPIRRMVTAVSDEERNTASVVDAIKYRYGLDAFARVIYTESHDEVANGKARVPQEIDPENPEGYFAQKRSTLGAALVMTAPGIPMIFQGQEFLQGEYFRDDVPLDWSLNEDFHGIVRLYRDLIRCRRNWNDLSRGLSGQYIDILHTNTNPDIIVFHRYKEGGPQDDVVVAVNMTNETWGEYNVGFPSAGEWKLLLNSDAKIYSDDFLGTEVFDVTAVEEGYDDRPAKATLTLPPYSVTIYSKV